MKNNIIQFPKVTKIFLVNWVIFPEAAYLAKFISLVILDKSSPVLCYKFLNFRIFEFSNFLIFEFLNF